MNEGNEGARNRDFEVHFIGLNGRPGPVLSGYRAKQLEFEGNSGKYEG